MSSSLDAVPKISAPATRALNNAGYRNLCQLADVPRAELVKLHGMGPKALRIIEDELRKHGLQLAQDQIDLQLAGYPQCCAQELATPDHGSFALLAGRSAEAPLPFYRSCWRSERFGQAKNSVRIGTSTSSVTPWPCPSSTRRSAPGIVAAMAEATSGDGSACVFGHYSGAALALEATARGVPVRKLAVYEPPYTTGPTDELAEQFGALAASGREGEAAERWMGTPPPVLEQMKAGPYWAHMCSFAHTLPYEIRLRHRTGVVDQQQVPLPDPDAAPLTVERAVPDPRTNEWRCAGPPRSVPRRRR